MIVKMTILRLLGSSDDKEKIGVVRPEGPHLRRRRADGGRGGATPRGSQGSALKALRSVAPEEPTHEHRCIRWLSEESTLWYFGAEGNRRQVSL